MSATCATLVITHDEAFMQAADEVVVLDGGRIGTRGLPGRTVASGPDAQRVTAAMRPGVVA